jgi:hypothetical protein
VPVVDVNGVVLDTRDALVRGISEGMTVVHHGLFSC